MCPTQISVLSPFCLSNICLCLLNICRVIGVSYPNICPVFSMSYSNTCPVICLSYSNICPVSCVSYLNICPVICVSYSNMSCNLFDCPIYVLSSAWVQYMSCHLLGSNICPVICLRPITVLSPVNMSNICSLTCKYVIYLFSHL